jgi:PqqD family protein of HPr-rel-A system
MTGSDLWRAADEGMLCRSWPDACVVYNPIRGETHLVTGVAASVMTHLLETSASVDDLIAAGVLPTSTDREGRDSAEQVQHVLSSLAGRGLALRVVSAAPLDEP